MQKGQIVGRPIAHVQASVTEVASAAVSAFDAGDIKVMVLAYRE